MSTRDLFDQAFSRPDDAGERERALDTTRSFIVQSPAGSGKTELLTQRYLALLAKVAQPEEVLAITFTRKATGEMRARILAALDDAERETPVAPHARRTFELVRAVAKRDRDKGWRLRAQPARLRIVTIDALCQSIARQMPWQSNFVGEANTVDDATLLYRETARDLTGLIDEPGPLGDAVAELLAHLDNDIARFEMLVVEMLARRDHWLQALFSERPDSGTLRTALESALQAAIERDLERLREVTPDELAQPIVETVAYIAETLRLAGDDSPVTRCAELDDLPGTQVEHAPLWQGIASVLLTSSGRWRKRVGIVPARAADARTKALLERAKALMGTLAALECDAFRTRLASVMRVPDARYSEEQWAVLGALIEVLRGAAALLRVVFARRAQVDFIEVVNAARYALGEPSAPSDLALSLDHRIAHILVDEFQDTSLSHYELLVQLTAGWQAGDGRTLFLVGDPMQSIYRFRQADVGVFLRTWRDGFEDIALETIGLRTNFRSNAELVQWVNRVFPGVFPRANDPLQGAVRFASSVAHRDRGAGGVELHPLLDASARDEARCVAGLVRDAARADAAQSIAILVRSRAHLGALLPELHRAGVRYRGVEIEPLSGVGVVQDLLALVRCLLQPTDRIAWLAVLRAPWCGLTLGDLHALAGAEHSASLFDLLHDRSPLAVLSADARRRAGAVLDVLADAHHQRARLPLRRWIEGIWLALNGPACAPSEHSTSAQAFFDLLETSEQRGSVDPDELSARVHELFAAPEVSVPEVEIMTMHKAKGLEFDVVILPGLARRPRADDRHLLAWTRAAVRDGSHALLLAPMPSPLGDEPPTYAYLRHLEMEKSQLETARLIYVAATRARRALHLVTCVSRKKDGALSLPPRGSALSHIWPETALELEQALRDVAPPDAVREDEPGRVNPLPLVRLASDWQPPPLPAAIAWPPGLAQNADALLEFEWVRPIARHVGTVVHRALSAAAEQGIDQLSSRSPAARRARLSSMLRSLGVSKRELGSAVARAEQALTRVAEDPRARWVVDADHHDAHSELALTAWMDGRTRRVVIDRTFVDASGTRWIVDFKTGRHEGGALEAFLDEEVERYREQLENYAEVMVLGGETRPIKLGLYFPVFAGWREWCYREAASV